jgi:alkanesulfonate monooxygenase SsuD/methylene tetrahydromethanopterin reductase-like flavin-dependent oxidoreductase (luciferase family)
MMGGRPPLQFGVNIPTSAEEGADPVAAAREAEQLGFDFVSANDHPGSEQPTFETWTMLSFIAASTSRIRIASRVLGVPYRAPAMVAKMAETMDRLSGGRLILGMGGGSGDEEHRAFGLGVRSPKDKTDGLAEAIEIIRGLWSTSRFTYTGRLYHTEDATIEPKPARPIPIWLGTFAPRALRVTGRLADGWIPSLGYAPPDDVVVLRRRVLAAAENAGRDPTSITCVYNIEVSVNGDGASAPDVVSGPPRAIVGELRRFVELGFSAFNFVITGAEPHEQLRRLADEVVAPLRENADA